MRLPAAVEAAGMEPMRIDGYLPTTNAAVPSGRYLAGSEVTLPKQERNVNVEKPLLGERKDASSRWWLRGDASGSTLVIITDSYLKLSPIFFNKGNILRLCSVFQ